MLVIRAAHQKSANTNFVEILISSVNAFLGSYFKLLASYAIPAKLVRRA